MTTLLMTSELEIHKYSRRCWKCGHVVAIHMQVIGSWFCCEGNKYESADCECRESDFECFNQFTYDALNSTGEDENAEV